MRFQICSYISNIFFQYKFYLCWQFQFNEIVGHQYINGITAWGLNVGPRIKTLQKKAIRYISNAKYNSHTTPVFKNLQLLQAVDIFKLACFNFFFYKCENRRIPDYFKNMFLTHDNTRRLKRIRCAPQRFNRIATGAAASGRSRGSWSGRQRPPCKYFIKWFFWSYPKEAATLNQKKFGLLPFGYELWVNKASGYIDKFSVICVWKLVVWILSAFSRCQRFSEHELGAKFECDQELVISGIDFQLLSSWMCVFVWWKWDEFANDFAPGTGSRYWDRPTDRDQPCLSEPDFFVLLGHMSFGNNFIK